MSDSFLLILLRGWWEKKSYSYFKLTIVSDGVLQGGHYNLIPNRHWNVRASAPVRRHIVLKVHSHREKAKTKCIQKNTNIHFFWKWHPQALATCLLSFSVSEPLDLLVLRSTFSDFGQRSTFWLELSSVFLERPSTRVELIPLALHSIHCLFVLFYRVKTVQISHWLRYC